MKLLLTFLSLAVLAAPGFSQDSTELRVKKHLGKANFLIYPGISYEVGVSKYTTIEAGVSLGYSIAFFDTFEGSETEVFIRPEAHFQIRRYYNFERRSRKGKNTKNNSANFIGLYASNLFKSLNEPSNIFRLSDNRFVVGPTWGINRTYPSGLALSLALGAGYQREFNNDGGDNYSSVGIITDFRLGFAIGRNRG